MIKAEKVPISILTRAAAYACYFSFDFYSQLAATGNPVGKAIFERHKPATNHLWRIAQLPVGDPGREALPDRCDRTWFINTYLGGNDPGDVADAWTAGFPHGRIQLYDPLNVASAVRPDLFHPEIIRVRGVDHKVIGVNAQKTGITDVNELRRHVAERELSALNSNSDRL